MGVGLVMIVAESEINNMRAALKTFPEFMLYEIGHVIEGERRVTLCA